MSGSKFNLNHLLKLSLTHPDCRRRSMVCMEIEVSLSWSIMTLHADIYEYGQWIKQARGIITLIVASITNAAQEHIQPTDCIKTAVNHLNYFTYISLYYLTDSNNVYFNARVQGSCV